jgi:hypothetical protein
MMHLQILTKDGVATEILTFSKIISWLLHILKGSMCIIIMDLLNSFPLVQDDKKHIL